MSNAILDLVRKNSNLVIDQQSNRPSLEESDVVINIDQVKDSDGAPVDTSGILENDLLDAQASRNVVDAMEPGIDDAVNDAAALESNAMLLRRARTERGGIDQQSAAIVTTNINNAVRRIGLTASAFSFPSTESFGGTATAYTSTERAEQLATDLSNARRVVAVEQAIVQAEAINNMEADFVEAAEGIAARASALETVVANITGEAPDQSIELADLTTRIGSKNGSVGTAAANLSNYIATALVKGAQQYNALGEAVAEVEAVTPDAADTVAAAVDVEVTEPAVETEADLAVGDGAAAATVAVIDETGTEEVTDVVATENVDKDVLVNETGTETTKTKPEDDVATSDTPAEAAEGSPVATTLTKPALEDADPEVTNIAESFNTDADLPGDAEVEFIEPDVAAGLVDESGDVGDAAAVVNATDVGVTAAQHTGVSLPVLSQAEALLILKSVGDIAQSIIQHKDIVEQRGGTLDGMHSQATEVASGALDTEAADAVNDAVDFNLAVYRKVSELERIVISHALGNCRDLLTYVGLSCKAYTTVPSVEESDVAPSVEPVVDAELPIGE